MKTLGLIGGISWVSTLDYYRYINMGINEQLGANNFARCIIHSFNYQDIIDRNVAQDHEGLFAMLAAAATNLRSSGAEALVLCANTMHLHAGALEQAVGLPVIHIARATAAAINAQGLTTVGLLGTKFTMERDFFKEKLTAQGITTIIPGDADRDFVHHTIFEELGRNIITDATRVRYIAIINELITRGAQGVILGCTEIPLLIKPSDVSIPTFDTARLHSDAAVAFSLGPAKTI